MSPSVHSAGAQFVIVPPESIRTYLISHKVVCVTNLSASPFWYYNDTLLSSSNSTDNYTIINVLNPGNYTCSVGHNGNYTVTLAKGL